MRFFKRLFLSGLLAGVAFAAWMLWFAFAAVPLKVNPLPVDIRAGLSLKGAAQAMVDAGAGMFAWQFTLLGRLSGRAAAIKAGSYEIAAGTSAWQLLKKLTAGDVTQSEILLVEGRTFRQLRAQLDAHPDLRHDTAGLSESEILARLAIGASHPEGLFFPDTYLFARQSSDLEILRRAHRAMEKRLASAWDSRNPAVPYRSAYEALIMASIVEKETGVAADRPKVASVFANRLRLGMLLQTDPTVIYGLGDKFDGNLRKIDLLTDSPYNTYTRPGLPPTPIAMPGMASIHAALDPPSTDFVYFVARGDGSSEFSRTLDEHNRAVAKYQKRRGG